MCPPCSVFLCQYGWGSFFSLWNTAWSHVDEALVKHWLTCWAELSKVSTAERQGWVKGQTNELSWVICLLITNQLFLPIENDLFTKQIMSFIPTFNQSNIRQRQTPPQSGQDAACASQISAILQTVMKRVGSFQRWGQVLAYVAHLNSCWRELHSLYWEL